MKKQIYLNEDEIPYHIEQYKEYMRSKGYDETQIQESLGKHYTESVIRKYTREEQDRMWDYLYHTIMDVPGGYWIVVENMHRLPEFEHYRFRCLFSESDKTFKNGGDQK